VSSSSSSSSSDRIDGGRGPLCQPSPGVSTTASPGPLGTNAKRCAVGDLLKPRVAWATCPAGQEPVRIAATLTTREGLACGRRVLPHGRTVSFASS